MAKEQKFYDALEDIFVGAKVEGESGYINLMRIKSRYYKKGVFPELQKDIKEALKPFSEFREELFDKLYTFFNRYFSESGSIYFRYTPIHQNVYEKVYTDDKDVMLFWKTHMLYYVKTDRLFKNLEVETDDFKFFFDVFALEHKKANEKREIVYEFKEKRDNGVIAFNVYYSERGRKTKIVEILRALKNEGVNITEDILEKAFRIFEKQSEVDYFINKNAKEFLREQFNIWLYQYVFSGESEWTEKRIMQLQALKDIAFKVIDFISQFEDELVKIWNKPKFVLNSNYVITIDRIAEKEKGIELIGEIFNHKGIAEQIKEWNKLGIDFDEKKIFTNSLNGKKLNENFQYLPVDTKYYDDEIKFKLLNLFDNLDDELDGWLIHSENYQALKTILPKFREKVQTIYIDPPFNLGKNADFLYNVNYKDANWITLLENRINLARDLINEKGSMFVRCDYNGNMFVRLLMNRIFGEENFRNENVINRTRAKQIVENQFVQQTESLFFYAKSDNSGLNIVERKTEPRWYPLLHFPREDTRPREILGKNFYPPKGRRWALSQERINKLVESYKVRINEELSYIDCYGNEIRGVPELLYDSEIVGNEWLDIPGYSQAQHFPTENSEILLKRVIESTSNEGNLILDFFLGSGTTTAVAHKLGRKWLGIEMGEHFNTVVLPRMKKVLAYDKSGISKDLKNYQGGGFLKYYELEQYEQTLKNAVYRDSHPFVDFNDKSIYRQYVFLKDLKMLGRMELDYKNNRIKINFDEIYQGIDIVETLSNLTGKAIKKINKNSVEFADGEEINYDNIDFNLIKPLIWW